MWNFQSINTAVTTWIHGRPYFSISQPQKWDQFHIESSVMGSRRKSQLYFGQILTWLGRLNWSYNLFYLPYSVTWLIVPALIILMTIIMIFTGDTTSTSSSVDMDIFTSFGASSSKTNSSSQSRSKPASADLDGKLWRSLNSHKSRCVLPKVNHVMS